VTHRGVPVERAIVDFDTIVYEYGHATTDSTGKFVCRVAFPNGDTTTLRVLAPSIPGAVENRFTVLGFAAGTSHPPTEIALPDGELEVELLGPRGGALRATVVLKPQADTAARDQLDDKLNDMLARVNRAKESGPIVAGDGVVRVETTTVRRASDSKGKVRFATLPPGRYSVTVEGDGGWMLEPVSVEVSGESPSFVTLRGAELGSLLVRVQDSAGRPIAGVDVELWRESNGEAFHAVKPQVTDRDGIVRMPAVTSGRVLVVASVREFMLATDRTARDNVDVDAGQEAHITLTLP
jgi:hypothetical protein